MRFEQLYSTEQAYIDDTTEFVELYQGAFLQVFGRGEGIVLWGDRRGQIEWTNMWQRLTPAFHSGSDAVLFGFRMCMLPPEIRGVLRASSLP